MKFTFTVCRQFVINALRFVAKPVICQPIFSFLCFILLNLLDLFADGGFPLLGPLLKITFGCFVCYCLLLPTLFLPSFIRRIYKFMVLLVAIVQFIVDLYLLIIYGETFSTLHVDMLAAFVATNPSEATEYLKSYLTIDKVFIISLSLSLLLVLFYFLRRIKFKANFWGECVISIIVLVSVCVSGIEYKNLLLGNIYFLFQTESYDLNEYRQNPELICSGEKPKYVVLIIGESFSKMHSSLYSYSKETNPLLSKLAADSLLFVCKNSTSACTKTIPAIKSIMTSYVNEMSDSIDWFKCLTLIEVMQKIDYKAVWISNHSRVGFFDNEAGCYAALCDYSVFANERDYYSRYDQVLLPLIEECLNGDSTQTFFVVNMLGSHIYYKDRYPEKFSKFKSEDYIASYHHLPTESRQTISEYDNSILYNDSVVYEIMKTFEQQDAIVVYISDHGQDIFNSSNDYAGHAINGNYVSEQVAVQVPLLVYTSPIFKKKHSLLYKRIESSETMPYRTDSIMYTIMDVAGIETVNGVSYKHKSLLK
ncbi:MAG: phosphoethanolamine transferase [Bacteroidaceae bacterium]|nr:phosphoethanolamine transferase [Bacteroidaceae bacterium]